MLTTSVRAVLIRIALGKTTAESHLSYDDKPMTQKRRTIYRGSRSVWKVPAKTLDRNPEDSLAGLAITEAVQRCEARLRAKPNDQGWVIAVIVR